MRSSTPSTPISIPSSGSNNAQRDRDSSRHSGYSSSSSSENERRHGASALSAAMERTDSLGDLQVGSLPMHLRRRSGRRSGTRQRQMSGGAGGFFGPQSLPPPKAPYLSSRGGPEGNLSRIPDMLLPESAAAASTDPELSSSVPYGSLRESKFAHPGFGFERMPAQSTHAQHASSFQPQSLPAYSGIGSYFNVNNNNLSRDSSISGIGSLIEESDEMGGMRQSDSLSGISQAFSSGLQINESDNYHDPGSMSTTVYQQPLRDGPTNNPDFAPLSSSLTALDILTQIRQNPDKETTTVSENNTTQLDNHSSHQHQYQREQLTAPQTYNLHQFGPFSAQNLNEAEQSPTHDEQIEDNNPDTFEAFDFELDD